MKLGTKRTVIAGAALVAAGLFGSLPWDGSSSLAQHGVPVEQHAVALVDLTTDAIVGTETAVDDVLYAEVLGSTSVESSLFEQAVTVLGANITDTLLGTTALAGADGIFDGSVNTFASGVFLDSWAAENEVNQLLGVSAATSEAAILADIESDPVTLALGGTLPTAGAAGFDTDLMSLASTDFTAGTSELATYLDSVPTVMGDFSSLATLLSEFGLGGVTGDLGTILGGLF